MTTRRFVIGCATAVLGTVLSGCAYLQPSPRYAPVLPGGSPSSTAPPAVQGVPPVGSSSTPANQPASAATNPNTATSATAQTPIVRGQDPGYGGRAVGAVSPRETTVPNAYQPYLPAQPTPGQAAWQTPYPGRTTAAPTYPAPNATGSSVWSTNPNAVRPGTSVTGMAPPTSALPVNAQRGSAGEVLGDPFNPLNPSAGLVTPMTGDKYIDIDSIVHETRTGKLMIGAGINSDAGLIGQVVIDEQNFDWRRFPTSWDELWSGGAWRGGGQRFRVEAMPGTQVQRYMASFTEPYFLDTRVSLSLSAYLYDRRFFDWDEERVGGRVGLGYQLPNDWSITGSLRAESVEISNPRVLPPVPELVEVLGQNDLYTARVSLVNDVRDSAFLPTQGHYLEFAYEQAFGDFNFPMGTVEARKYFTLAQRIDGSGRHVLNVGGIFGVSGSDTPVFENFFAGGFATIRGFQFRGASPRTNTVIVGGRMQLLTTVEYMFPITADDMLRGVLFVDAGTVERDVEFSADTFRVSPGFGLRISHPGLGPAPIALDLAFPVAHADDDQIRNFTFFIGVRR